MMMMGNAQIRTYTRTFQAAGRVRTISQNAKTAANQSTGGFGRLETRRSHSKSFRETSFARFVRLFNTSGASAHTHTHSAGTAIVTRDESRGSTVESDFGETTPRARVSTILNTLPSSCSSPAQLLIHLSFSPLFPFLSSAHVFFLIFFFSPGFSGLQSNRDGMMMILLISITILFFFELLRTDFFPRELRSIFLNCSANG